MREPVDVEEYVAGLWVDPVDVSLHVMRTDILERFTALDAALNDVLAMRFARDQVAADVLADRVFSRLPMQDRTTMLAEVLKEEDLEDRWPFLVEVLRRLSTLRNALAHGFVERVEDGEFQVTSVNRGKVSHRVYSSRELAWLAWQSQVSWTELRALWAVLVPDADDWFEQEAVAG